MKSFLRFSCSAFAVLALALVISGAQNAFAQSTIVISEFRFRGPLGANDEFIEIMNNTDEAVTVPAGGWALRRTNTSGTLGTVFIVPEGTVIPARGHFLAVNSTASTGFTSSPSSGYSAGNGATVGSGDVTYTIGVVDGGGIALFNSATTFDATTRLDAVGFAPAGTTTPDPLYREGTGLLPAGGLGSTNGEYSFVRRMASGRAQDTGDNQADFDFVFTGTPGTIFNTRVPTLGAPGPERLASPIQRNAFIKASLIFPCTDTGVDGTGCQNRDRSMTAVTNGQFGTLAIRRRFINTTSSSITTLRFRIVDITTAPATAESADLRALSSNEVTIDSVVIQGTTLETPPAQPNGGGLNSSLSCCNGTSGQVSLTTPLAPNASIDVQFVLGVMQNGSYRFFVNVEALPANSGSASPSKTKVQRNFAKRAN